jgi:hypothetical protein
LPRPANDVGPVWPSEAGIVYHFTPASASRCSKFNRVAEPLCEAIHSCRSLRAGSESGARRAVPAWRDVARATRQVRQPVVAASARL